jgi:pimeloyl-ACP methyl ester carboxylesterase
VLADVQDRSSTLRLPDGRRLAYAEYGDPAGRPLIYNHGLLSSRFEAAFADGAARRLGLRLIAVDRPGCGGSDPLPGRKLLDWPRDIAALAVALRLPHFHVFGVSGGGPYALACAGTLAGRVTGVTLVCPLGPPDTLSGLEEGAGTRLFEFAGRHPAAARVALAPLGLWLRYWPIVFAERMMAAASPADRAALREPPIRAGFAAALREGVRQGVGGALADIVLYTRDWGFGLEDVRVPVQLWQGGADHTVPPAVARYLAARLPQCAERFLPDEGHFSLPVRQAPAILAAIVGGAD